MARVYLVEYRGHRYFFGVFAASGLLPGGIWGSHDVSGVYPVAAFQLWSLCPAGRRVYRGMGHGDDFENRTGSIDFFPLYAGVLSSYPAGLVIFGSYVGVWGSMAFISKCRLARSTGQLVLFPAPYDYRVGGHSANHAGSRPLERKEAYP